VVAAAISIACAASNGSGDTGAATAAGASQGSTIDHVAPPRDSTGPTPARFAWTSVEGADRYAIGLWNDVDVLVMKATDVRQPFLDFPKDHPLDPGTYFWSVTAFRADRPIAESGRSAFVVVPR
jgi:hypothetical protein